MAIGSAPEIGVTFTTFGELPADQQHLWYEHIKRFGPDLVDGYATLAYPSRPVLIPPLALSGVPCQTN